MSLVVVADLRSMLGDARDQGRRPTCLAFAASDAHAALRPGWAPLSCEYLFYTAQKSGSRPLTTGALLTAVLNTLEVHGQPLELEWPYTAVLPEVHDDWQPPAAPSSLFRRRSTRAEASISWITSALDQGVPVLLGLSLSPAFYSPRDGLVVPAAGEKPDINRRHAVVAVGHGTLSGEPALLIRNSWGTRYGDNGHAWLTGSYVPGHIRWVAKLLDDPDVHSNSASN